ncbi:hypothetical protein TraAM80_08038, partial [Trypanosoma rangeli]
HNSTDTPHNSTDMLHNSTDTPHNSTDTPHSFSSKFIEADRNTLLEPKQDTPGASQKPGKGAPVSDDNGYSSIAIYFFFIVSLLACLYFYLYFPVCGKYGGARSFCRRRGWRRVTSLGLDPAETMHTGGISVTAAQVLGRMSESPMKEELATPTPQEHKLEDKKGSGLSLLRRGSVTSSDGWSWDGEV